MPLPVPRPNLRELRPCQAAGGFEPAHDLPASEAMVEALKKSRR